MRTIEPLSSFPSIETLEVTFAGDVNTFPLASFIEILKLNPLTRQQVKIHYSNSLKPLVKTCTVFLKYCSHIKGVTVSPFQTGTVAP